MFANRLTKHFRDQHQAAPASTKQAFIPAGFVQLPTNMQGETKFTELYRAAYESAQREAREKLLILLRSRAGWN